MRILAVGVDGLLTRIQLIKAAQKTLDLQYYIFRGDQSGSFIREALNQAASRGVRIRLLVDDADTRPGDEQLFALSHTPNVEVRVYNPWVYRGHLKLIRGFEFLTYHRRLDYRMHNKLLIADQAVALAGGRNIGDQYFQIDPDSQFADDDVFCVGPVVQGLQGSFEEFWNSELAIPSESLGKPPANSSSTLGSDKHLLTHSIQAAAASFSKRLDSGEPLASLVAEPSELIWAHARVVADSPNKKEIREGGRAGTLMYQPVAEAVRSVRHELLMITPYFVPSTEELQLLKAERAMNARVAILTNSMESAPEISAHAGYMHYRVPLLRAGVELNEVRAFLESTRGSGQSKSISEFGNFALHGKLLIFDRQQLYIGSMNFDRRSRFLNTELGLIIDSPAMAQQMVQRFSLMTQPESAYAVILKHPEKAADHHLLWKTRVHGQEVIYDREPARSVWQKIKAKVLTLLPLDPEL